MRTLVTGGAGFIGSHLVDALLARGDDVTIVDDLSGGRESNIAAALASGARLERADIRDGAALARIVEAARPQTIFHLAAQVDVRRSLADPAFDARTNVEGTINVLEAARAAGSERVVFSSTGGAIYGETDVLPTPETEPALPMAAYGQSKRCRGAVPRASTSALYGMSTLALRFGNVYGPRQDPHGEAGVIAIFCGRLRAGDRPRIYGDGTQTRDYVYVGDLVEALVLGGDRCARRRHERRHRGGDLGARDRARARRAARPGRAGARVRARAAGRGRALVPRRRAGARAAGVAVAHVDRARG